MILEPGMEVECVDGHGLVVTGEKYIIDQIFPVGFQPWVHEDMVSLVGVHRAIWKTALIKTIMYQSGISGDAPTAFAVHRFRPLRKKKTDISVFNKFLRENEKV